MCGRLLHRASRDRSSVALDHHRLGARADLNRYMVGGRHLRVALSCNTVSRCSPSSITFSHRSRIEEGICGLLASNALALSIDARHADALSEEIERSRCSKSRDRIGSLLHHHRRREVGYGCGSIPLIRRLSGGKFAPPELGFLQRRV
jgi:hypothetical protein